MPDEYETETLSISGVPTDLKEWLDDRSALEDRSLSSVVRRILQAEKDREATTAEAA